MTLFLGCPCGRTVLVLPSSVLAQRARVPGALHASGDAGDARERRAGRNQRLHLRAHARHEVHLHGQKVSSKLSL